MSGLLTNTIPEFRIYVSQGPNAKVKAWTTNKKINMIKIMIKNLNLPDDKV